MVTRYIQLLLPILAFILFPQYGSSQTLLEYTSSIEDSVNVLLRKRALPKRETKLETIIIKSDSIHLFFNRQLAEYPIREDDFPTIYNTIKRILPEEYSDYNIRLFSNGTDIEYYISRYYSKHQNKTDFIRTPDNEIWIQNHSLPYKIPQGLDGRNIAIWAGHGAYYNADERRWMWQRAPFFTTIEDLLPHYYLTEFIIPMLENAGATVLTPRERDFNKSEIIIDNNSSFYTERNTTKSIWTDAPAAGFKQTDTIYSAKTNPFTLGSARMISVSKRKKATASFLPFFPKTDKYAVYVTYLTLPESGTATYTVRHSGGESHFTIDQRKGGSTWIYLGTYTFTKGETGQGVSVSNVSTQYTHGKVITADAVRFGGGMGIIAKDSTLSGFSKYIEAGRYSLQAYGFSPDVFNSHADSNDYRDDYISKGLWVNSLMRDFSIPVDMALALHTDAGIKQKDSIVGTLAIYKEISNKSKYYSDGTERRTARELAEIVQSSIVEDIKSLYLKRWNRRGLWDRSYMEARIPDIPTVLIELLSHQNMADMNCALDPKFQFIVSRSIYKGILKYLSFIYNTDYTVQPLPVSDPTLTMIEKKGKAEIRLSWKPTSDLLEPTATPTAYLIQTRISEPDASTLPGFDKGVLVTGTEYVAPVEQGKIYSYRITAINKGGASFPSEILSAGYIPDTEEVLIINAFKDVRKPDFNSGKGIPYLRSYALGGKQYDFDSTSVWTSDETPGFGASYKDFIGTEIAGNTFDYPLIHGRAVMKAGYSFVSASIGALEEKTILLNKYKICDIIFGEEKDSLLNNTSINYFSDYCKDGGNLIISGSNIDQIPEKFASDILKIDRCDKFTNPNGKLITALDSTKYIIDNKHIDTLYYSESSEFCNWHYQFNIDPNPYTYPAISANTFISTDTLSSPILIYEDIDAIAAFFYDGDDYRCATFGFPLETLTSQEQIDFIIKESIERIKR